MEALGVVFAICIVIPAMWYARKFFRSLKEEELTHQVREEEELRRQHWRQNWRR